MVRNDKRVCHSYVGGLTIFFIAAGDEDIDKVTREP